MAAARGILALGHADYLFWVAGVSRHPGAVLLSLLWHGMDSGGGALPGVRTALGTGIVRAGSPTSGNRQDAVSVSRTRCLAS